MGPALLLQLDHLGEYRLDVVGHVAAGVAGGGSRGLRLTGPSGGRQTDRGAAPDLLLRMNRRLAAGPAEPGPARYPRQASSKPVGGPYTSGRDFCDPDLRE